MALVGETYRVLLKLPRDPRLVAGVGGAVGYFADRIGFDAHARADLIAAAEKTCRVTFPLLTSPDDTLDVLVEGFSDRIEVNLEHHGQAVPTAGLETFAFPGTEEATPGRLSGLALLARVDRVLYDTEGNTSRMRLVKYVGGKPKS